MTDAAQRQTTTLIISALLAVVVGLALLLWNNQQGVIQQLSDRINRIETVCKADLSVAAVFRDQKKNPGTIPGLSWFGPTEIRRR